MIAAFWLSGDSRGLVGAWRHRQAASATENALINLICIQARQGPLVFFRLGGVNVGRSCDLAS